MEVKNKLSIQAAISILELEMKVSRLEAEIEIYKKEIIQNAFVLSAIKITRRNKLIVEKINGSSKF